MRDVSDLVSPECPGINCTDPVLSDEHSFSVFPPLQSNTFEFNVIFLCLFCISLCFFKYTNLIAGEVDSVQEFCPDFCRASVAPVDPMLCKSSSFSNGQNIHKSQN